MIPASEQELVELLIKNGRTRNCGFSGTPMFEIVNINSLKLSVLVDESQVGKIQLGQQVAINVNVLPEDSFSGRITFIAPKVMLL